MGEVIDTSPATPQNPHGQILTEAWQSTLVPSLLVMGIVSMGEEGGTGCALILYTWHNILVPTLLLPRALLEMLESLLATISTSLAKIPIQVELSSPERQLEGRCTNLVSFSLKDSMEG